MMINSGKKRFVIVGCGKNQFSHQRNTVVIPEVPENVNKEAHAA